MKKCSRCSKPATLHITDIRDGNVHALHLCENCAQEYLNQPHHSDSVDDSEALAEKLAEMADDELDELDTLVCPHCEITFREFRGQGRLGCPQCYIAFEQELTPLLENIHNETQHVGKCPRRAPHASQQQYELIKLRNQLRGAVEEEQYEEAARLRDQIQSLEEDLDDGSRLV